MERIQHESWMRGGGKVTQEPCRAGNDRLLAYFFVL